MAGSSAPRRRAPGVVRRDGRAFSAADLATIEALARLALGARRLGLRIRIEAAPPAVRELVELCGLGEVIPCDERGPDV